MDVRKRVIAFVFHQDVHYSHVSETGIGRLAARGSFKVKYLYTLVGVLHVICHGTWAGRRLIPPNGRERSSSSEANHSVQGTDEENGDVMLNAAVLALFTTYV